MSEIAKRLNEALRASEKSKRSFQKSMADRGVPGSSEPAVYRYLRGESEPSFAFVQAAADELNVNPAWLAFGSLPRDVPVEVGYSFKQLEASNAEELFAESFPLSSQISAWVVPIVWEAVDRLVAHDLGTRPPKLTPEIIEIQRMSAVFVVAHALSKPLEHSPLNADHLVGDRLDRYTLHICQALMHLVPAER